MRASNAIASIPFVPERAQRSTAAEFLADPRGRYVVGRSWVEFAMDGFAGAILHDSLTAADLRELLPLTRAAHGPSMPPHVALIDGTRVRYLEPSTFGMVALHVDAHRRELEGKVVKLAGVLGPGLPGAVAEGFFRMVRLPYPIEIFADRAAAMRWLGVEHLGEAMVTIDRAAAEGGPAIADLAFELLGEDPTSCTLLDVAKRLGVSARTLQRRLFEEQTTFQEQLNLARVRKAQQLMLETGLSIAGIALEVGCASASSFTVMFRRLVGLTPREWARSAKDRAEAEPGTLHSRPRKDSRRSRQTSITASAKMRLLSFD